MSVRRQAKSSTIRIIRRQHTLSGCTGRSRNGSTRNELAGSAISSVLVVIVLAAGKRLLGFAGTQFPTYREDHPKFWLFVAAVVVLALGIVVGGAALWPRRVKITPEPARLIDDYVSTATNIMIYDLIQAGREAYEQNAAGGAATWRSRFVRLQLVGLAAGAMLLAAGVLAPHV